jgi:hypothetical protein
MLPAQRGEFAVTGGHKLTALMPRRPVAWLM